MLHSSKDFITESHELGMPFMLYFNPTTPHSPDVFQALFDFSILETPAGNLMYVDARAKTPSAGAANVIKDCACESHALVLFSRQLPTMECTLQPMLTGTFGPNALC